jgi:hypothetical protein
VPQVRVLLLSALFCGQEAQPVFLKLACVGIEFKARLMDKDSKSFTIRHPLLSILIVSSVMVVAEFAFLFPPLVHVPERTQEWLCYDLLPLSWALISAVLLARSVLERLLPRISK